MVSREGDGMTARGTRPRVVLKNDDNRGGAERSPACSPSIEYMSDLILELKEMAGRGGYGTLSGILEVAYQEARSKARGF